MAKMCLLSNVYETNIDKYNSTSNAYETNISKSKSKWHIVSLYKFECWSSNHNKTQPFNFFPAVAAIWQKGWLRPLALFTSINSMPSCLHFLYNCESTVAFFYLLVMNNTPNNILLYRNNQIFCLSLHSFRI